MREERAVEDVGRDEPPPTDPDAGVGDPAGGAADGSEVARADRPPLDIAAALRQATWRDGLCLGGILASVLIGYISLPLAPTLLRHVLPHLLITGSVTALLTGGAAVYNGEFPFVVAVLAGVVGVSSFDGFFFWAGRRYGDHVAHFLETHGGLRPRTVARIERWIDRFGLPILTASYFLPIPTYVVILLLGASDVRWRSFIAFDFVGSAAWCVLFVWLGHHFHDQVDHIAHVVTHYSRISTIVLVAVIVAVSVIRGMRQHRTSAA